MKPTDITEHSEDPYDATDHADIDATPLTWTECALAAAVVLLTIGTVTLACAVIVNHFTPLL